MLVVKRKRRESVLIRVGDQEIRVKLLRIKGESAQIGFEAPREMQIIREENAQDQELAVSS